MMKLSAQTRYGIQALIVLARSFSDGKPIRLRNLARECSAPEKYLVQILQRLRRAGLVQGVRGSNGGYRLSRGPQQIKLKDVLDLLEGPLMNVAGPNGSNLNRVMEPIWRRVDEAIRSALSGVTLDVLAERWSRVLGPMYHI